MSHTKSNQNYNNILANLDFDIAQTLQTPISAEILELIKKAERILITGNGSSFPAANFLAKFLTLRKSKKAIFCPTGELLDGSTKFAETDLIIMVSQGWGRGEAYLLTQKFVKLGIKMVIITGHLERKTELYQNADNLFPVEISPQNEKIFCRPNSPLTSFLKICELCQIEINPIKISQIHEEIKNEIQNESWLKTVSKIQKASKVVILSSGLALPSCQNLALALREGSGIAAEVMEIETYGHGWYTTDQSDEKALYLLVSHKNYAQSLFAKSRIESLVKNGNCDFLEITTDLDEVYGNIWTLIWTAYLVQKLNFETIFDMNNPLGMESNRSFHEIAEVEKNPLQTICKKIENKLVAKYGQNWQNSGQRIITAVAGGSATGKTSQISKNLKDYFDGLGLKSQILSQDNWQIGREFVDQFENLDPGILSDQQKKLQNEIKQYKWDHPQNFDLDSCKKALEQILEGKVKIEIPNFDLKNAQRNGSQIFEPTQITIFEGIYSFFGELTNFEFDYHIYGQNPLWARLLKRYFRFVYQMNIPKPEKALKQILGSVLNAHRDFVHVQTKTADEIINLDYSFAKTIEILDLQPKGINLKSENEILQKNLEKKYENLTLDGLKMIWNFEFENGLGKLEIWHNLETGQNYFGVFYDQKYWEFLEIETEIAKLFENLDLNQN